MSNSSPTHTNRLINETSPYLLQHAHNPVDWYAWGEEALARARDEDKPIFLSIGYSACHWCHVMERESFENAQTAAMMNELFVNIKVDREERPDLDSIYMEAVTAMTQQGGWPMSVFLTPDGEPFYGGTYYPPEPRYGMPSFQQVLMSVADAYENRSAQVREQAQRLTAQLARTALIDAAEQDLGAEVLDEALANLRQYFDEYEGGFGQQPKFPQPMTLDFAMSQYARTGDPEALYMAELTLEKMAQGGIYDQLGGGFHRYSVDAIWLVPHFEKMLYDNSQLLRSYLHMWQITQKPLFLHIVNETIDYVLREMTAPAGGFYSTQDADSEGEEGKFFVWSPAEIETLLGAENARLFNAHFGVSPRGNFEGHNILNINMTLADVARRFGKTEQAVAAVIAEGKHALFAARELRIKPARDEKVLTEWNGLMIHALADCGAVLGRADVLDAARKAANFVLDKMSQPDGKLYRSWTPPQLSPQEKGRQLGGARFNAYLEDYAAFIRSLIALYEATFELRWLGEASRLTQLMLSQFGDEERGGFFQTGVDHEQLVVRRKDFIDNAIPSGNSLAAEALLRLSVLTGNQEYRQRATAILLMMKEAMAQQPTGFGRLLGVLNALLSPSQEVAIVGDPQEAATQALLDQVRQRYLPTTVLALKRPNEESMLPLLEGRTLVDGKAAAYVCENYACQLPVTTAEALGRLL
ncbi:MAG: thioredoxin domain-containing protein [Caldilineaceae bacterium]|nr:thioredoxin domain-containing protein [Caldilineaceae bacterium]